MTGKLRYLTNPTVIFSTYPSTLLVPMFARSKAWVCGRSLIEFMGSSHAGGIDVLSLVSVVCCQVEVSASG